MFLPSDLEKIIHTFIFLLLSGIKEKSRSPLQLVAAARLLPLVGYWFKQTTSHYTDFSLLWLPVCFRIDFKI